MQVEEHRSHGVAGKEGSVEEAPGPEPGHQRLDAAEILEAAQLQGGVRQPFQHRGQHRAVGVVGAKKHRAQAGVAAQGLHDLDRGGVGQRHPQRDALGVEPGQQLAVDPVGERDAAFLGVVQADAAQSAVLVQRLQLAQGIAAWAGHPLGEERLLLPFRQGLVPLDRADPLPLPVVDEAAADAVAVHFLQQAVRVRAGGGPVVPVADADVGVEHGNPGAEVESAHRLQLVVAEGGDKLVISGPVRHEACPGPRLGGRANPSPGRP